METTEARGNNVGLKLEESMAEILGESDGKEENKPGLEEENMDYNAVDRNRS